MIQIKKPFLVLPKCIEQPTWGGSYIAIMKGWSNRPDFQNKNIGQSYELFGESKLLININDSEDPTFIAELGIAESNKAINKTGYKKNIDYVDITSVTSLQDKIPLIKITQALGNSFQLHLKAGINDKRWSSKAESWYYFEDGLLTFGIKNTCNLDEYKQCCLAIEKEMFRLSTLVKQKKIAVIDARKIASKFIKEKNPWQYINLHKVTKDTLIDLSRGATHHSWESNINEFPLGNVLYEIQQDIMDPISTIRSFDQGKISNNGSIREIHINDYFKYIDTNPSHNDINNHTLIIKDTHLLKTKYYSLDLLKITKNIEIKTNNSFHHLFVKEGKIIIHSENHQVFVGKGHSCFVPESVIKYTIEPNSEKACVIKAFIT